MSITGNPVEQRRAKEGMLIHVILIYILKSTSLRFFVLGSTKKQIQKIIFTPPRFPFDFSGHVRRIKTLFSLHFPLEYMVDCEFKILIAL